MGKSKDEPKRKRYSSPQGEDEERSKRRKSKEEDENHKSKKKHKSSKHRSDKGKKSGEKRKDKGERSKHDKSTKLNIQELSNDDYFSKNNEFALWLKEEKNVFFSDLSSESARSLFSKFVKKWNNQGLESKYYEGIATGPRTAHNWKIKK